MKTVETTKALKAAQAPRKAAAPFFEKGGGSFMAQGDQPVFFSSAQPVVSTNAVQTKLSVGAPGDAYEKEADDMADQVVQRLQAPSAVQQGSPSALVQTKCAHCTQEAEQAKEEDEKVQVQGKSDVPEAPVVTPGIENSLQASRGTGTPLPAKTRSLMESAMGADFSRVRIHSNSTAVQLSKDLQAQAFASGNDIYFNTGKYEPETARGQHLLAHELTHVIQQGAAKPALQRHPVAPTPVNRKTQADIFGVAGAGGITLGEFKQYTEEQADWFTEPSLTAADRTDLWSLLMKTRTGSPVLSGVGNVQVNELRTVTAVQWTDLEVFCRGCYSEGHTVRLTPAGALADRIALGGTLRQIETVIPGIVLEATITQTQLETIQREGLTGRLVAYWTLFQPQLQETVGSASALAAGVKSESQLLIDFLRGPNIAPFGALLGRMRNLHRFDPAALLQVQNNFANFERRKPVYLILYSGHDANSAFIRSQFLFERLMRDASKLVLVLEGQASLQAIIDQVPHIAATYGQPDATGTPRIAQVMIAGHGGSRSVELAGTGAPQISASGEVLYQTEKLDLDQNNAQSVRLLETLMDNMDPATARIVYAGCLVGSTAVPLNNAAGNPMSAADITAHVNNPANTSLADFTRQLAASRGKAGMTVEGGRGSVALADSRALQDAAGNLHIDYNFDPVAFGTALTYVAEGREPEGVMRAAVEIAVTNSPVVAANQLRIHQGRRVVDAWYDPVTLAFINAALDGVAVGAGIDIVKVNKLAHMADPFLLSFWASRSVAHFGGSVNPDIALATRMYTDILAIPAMAAPADILTKQGRFITEMGRVLIVPGAAPGVIAFLDAQPSLTPDILRRHIKAVNLAWLNTYNASTSLFPAGAAATDGRIRLALAWIITDNGNADVRAFLDAQVDAGAGRPRLKPPVLAQLSNPADENDILRILGRLVPALPPPGGAGPALDPANADVFPDGRRPHMNDVRIEPNVYTATVIAPAYALNIRTRPSMNGRPFHWLHRGDTVQVMGFVHGWAAVDINGKLGFAYGRFLSAPPP